MANPPITIGELNDVPAVGSGIKSAWCQEVTNRIHHRFATVAALNAWAAPEGSMATVGRVTYLRTGGIWQPPYGTVVYIASLLLPNLNTTTGGLRDLATLGPAAPFPYPVLGQLAVDMFAGGAAAASAYSADMVTFGGTTIHPTTGQLISDASYMTALAMKGIWAIPTNTEPRAKTRITVLSPGGTFSTGGNAVVTYFAN